MRPPVAAIDYRWNEFRRRAPRERREERTWGRRRKERDEEAVKYKGERMNERRKEGKKREL